MLVRVQLISYSEAYVDNIGPSTMQDLIAFCARVSNLENQTSKKYHFL